VINQRDRRAIVIRGRADRAGGGSMRIVDDRFDHKPTSPPLGQIDLTADRIDRPNVMGRNSAAFGDTFHLAFEFNSTTFIFDSTTDLFASSRFYLTAHLFELTTVVLHWSHIAYIDIVRIDHCGLVLAGGRAGYQWRR
jgi:hypothetical protein